MKKYLFFTFALLAVAGTLAAKSGNDQKGEWRPWYKIAISNQNQVLYGSFGRIGSGFRII
jgi:hypothetical protein